MSFPYTHGSGFPGGDNFSTPSTPHDAFPVWDTIEGEQKHQPQQSISQQQQQQNIMAGDLQSPVTATTPHVYPRTIQIDDPPVVPSHDDSVRLHPVHADPRSDLLQTYAGNGETLTRVASPSTWGVTSSDSAQNTPGGLLRSGRVQHHQAQQQTHPYRRPSTSTSAAAAAANPRHIALQQQHQYSQQGREQHVHFAPVPSIGRSSGVAGTSSARGSPLVPSPTSRTASFGSSVSNSPVVATLPESSLALSPPQGMPPPQLPGASPSTYDATTPQAAKAEQGTLKRPWIIRMDTHYDTETHVLTAVLEVPGVKREHLNVRLSTGAFNRVRQITISGVVLPPQGIPPLTNARTAASEKANTKLSVRERRYGAFSRTMPVPSELKREDIEAQLQDGVLVLRFPCGMPPESDEEEEILVN